jgi:hypothetical protein
MSGADNFLGGLAEIADMVVGQAGSIVKMRIGAAAQRAEGEVGLLNAKFLSDLTSLDPKTGEFKIKPEDFESAFANHKATLEGYADTTDFAPAKDAIRGVAMKALPELYVRGAQAMNKQMFANMAADWTKGYDAISSDPYKNATEKKDARMASIDLARRQGWADPIKIEEIRAQALNDYKIGSAMEELNTLTVSEAIAKSEDPEWKNSKGLSEEEGIKVSTGIKRIQIVSDEKLGNDVEKILEQNKNDFIAEKDSALLFDDRKSSSSAIAKGKLEIDSHNVDIMQKDYDNRRQNAPWYDGGSNITSLIAQREELARSKLFLSQKGQEVREVLIDKITQDLNQYYALEGNEIGLKTAKEVSYGKTMLAAMAQSRTTGVSVPGLKIDPTDEKALIAEGFKILDRNGDAVITEWKEFMKSVTTNHPDQYASISTATLNSIVSMDAYKNDSNVRMDIQRMYQQALEYGNDGDGVKVNATISAMYQRANKALKVVVPEQKLNDNQFIAFGESFNSKNPTVVLPNGEFATGKGDVGQAFLSWEMGSLVNTYGFPKGNIDVIKLGTPERKYSIDGTVYQMDYKKGKQILYKFAPDGQRKEEVPTITQVNDAAKFAITQQEAASKYPEPTGYKGTIPWSSMTVGERVKYYIAHGGLKP